MNSSDFRTEARKRLTGKWGKAVLIMLCYTAITIIFNFIENGLSESFKTIFSLIVFLLEVPLSFGLVASFIKLYNDDETNAFEFIVAGFNNFGKAWGIALRTFLKLLLPFILLIVSLFIMLGGSIGILVGAGGLSQIANPDELAGAFSASFGGVMLVGIILYFVSLILLICQSYYYSLANLIAIENENLTSKECVKKSKELMTGNRSKLFWLQLSFIGWAILSIFTLGIGYLWLAPYMQIATIAFYKHLEGNNGQINISE